MSTFWQLPIAERMLDPESDWTSDQVAMRRTIVAIEKALAGLRVRATVVEVNDGPREMLYTLEPGTFGRYASRSHSLNLSTLQRRADDLALSLAVPKVSVSAAGSGREGVVLGVPHSHPHPVTLANVLRSPAFARMSGALKLALGLDAGGVPVAIDLAAMPHILIGGTAGSGKSTCIHAFIASLLFHSDPDSVQLLLIDTKMVELGLYDGIPHLVAPVITDLSHVASSLEMAKAEGTKRLEQFRGLAVRDIREYNRRAASSDSPRLPFIVIVVDDVAELLATAPRVAAETLTGLAADGRTVGIHLIVATSRPSDTLVARSIKVNFPARIALRVSSSTESRIILNREGAERLSRNGDMLFLRPDTGEPVRIQGANVSDGEISRIAGFWCAAEAARQREKIDEARPGSGISSVQQGGEG